MTYALNRGSHYKASLIHYISAFFAKKKTLLLLATWKYFRSQITHIRAIILEKT